MCPTAASTVVPTVATSTVPIGVDTISETAVLRWWSGARCLAVGVFFVRRLRRRRRRGRRFVIAAAGWAARQVAVADDKSHVLSVSGIVTDDK